MYYKLITGDERDTLQFGGSSFDGASTTKPTLNKPTDAECVNAITGSINSLCNGNSSGYSSYQTYLETFNDYGYCHGATTADASFNNCKALKSCSIDCYSLTTMRYMFQDCQSLTDLNIKIAPNCWEGLKTFTRCYALKSVNIQMPNLSVANYMFTDCQSLTNVNLGTSLGNVYEARHIFEGCVALEEITLPDLPSLIHGDYMFAGCSSLTKVNHGLLGGALYNGGSLVNSYLGYSFKNCIKLSSFDMKDVVTYNYGYMFQNCPRLTTITNFSSTFECKTDYMFDDCTLLTNIELYIPNCTSSTYMFRNSGVSTITGTFIASICDGEFYGCSSLTTLNTAGRTSYSSSSNMFYGCVKLKGAVDFDSTKLDASMATPEGYLTYTRDKTIYNITYNYKPFLNNESSWFLTNFKGIKGSAVDGELLTIKSNSDYYKLGSALIADSNNNYNVKIGDEITIPVQDDLTIFLLPQLGSSGSLNALVSAIINP